MYKFVSEKRKVNFEGCKFDCFSFQTSEKDVAKKLRDSKFYGKGFFEIDFDKKIGGLKLVKNDVSRLSVEELEDILAKKKAKVEVNKETGKYDMPYFQLLAFAKTKGYAQKQGNPKKNELVAYLEGLESGG